MNKKTQYTVEMLRKLVIKVCHSAQLSLYHNKRGSKKYNQHQLVALLILKARTGLSLRRFVEWLYETKWPEWLKLKDIPSHMTIFRALARLGMKILRRINLAILKLGKIVKILAIDATGIDSIHRSRHYESKINERTPYLKLNALINTKDLLVHDFTIRAKPRHDSVGATKMLQRMKHKNILIIGDKGYDSENLCRIAAKNKNRFYAPLRKRERKRIKGYYRRQNNQGLLEYHQRSLSETCFSIIKRCYQSNVRSKKTSMKKRELTWKIITYNIERIIKISKIFLWLLKKRATRYRALF